MANGRIPGPLRGYDYLELPRGPLGCEGNGFACEGRNTPGPIGVRDRRPIRVADAEKRDSKKPAKKPSTPASAQTVHLHFYMPVTGSYSATSLFEWLRGPEDFDHPLTRWAEADIGLILHKDKNSAVGDFKKSLQEPGAVVVYLGHSALDFKNKRSLGLTPTGSSKPEIPAETVTPLLQKSKASLVILASCDSQSCVGKLTGGPAVVVTDSGKDLKTWSTDWAHALGAFLFVLLGFDLDASEQPQPRKKGRGTINEALDASAEAFKNAKTTDRFKLVNGDGSTIIFAQK